MHQIPEKTLSAMRIFSIYFFIAFQTTFPHKFPQFVICENLRHTCFALLQNKLLQ